MTGNSNMGNNTGDQHNYHENSEQLLYKQSLPAIERIDHHQGEQQQKGVRRGRLNGKQETKIGNQQS